MKKTYITPALSRHTILPAMPLCASDIKESSDGKEYSGTVGSNGFEGCLDNSQEELGPTLP